MARKTIKIPTIQATVDQYATQRAKAIKFRKAMGEAEIAYTKA